MHGVILLAAGSGNRMKGEVKDKLLHPIQNSNAFRLSAEAFLAVKKIEYIVIVFRNEEQMHSLKLEFTAACINAGREIQPRYVKGGKERKDSVNNGLLVLPKDCRFVQVHDCARPMIRPSTISLITEEVFEKGAVVVGRPMTDTVRKLSHPELEPSVPQNTETIDRSTIWTMETPQASDKTWLIDALALSKTSSKAVTDEVSALELIGKKVAFHNIDYPNPKITTSDDFLFINYLLSK